VVAFPVPARLRHIYLSLLAAYSGRKRPAFRRENGHHSDGKTAGVPIGMRPPFR